MEERKVVAFQNCNPYPVSFDIRGIRGKVLLYEGQQIRDREGNPIIPPESEWSWLIQRGVKPVYLETGPALPKPEEAPAEDRTVVLDDLKLMEKKAAADAQNL